MVEITYNGTEVSLLVDGANGKRTLSGGDVRWLRDHVRNGSSEGRARRRDDGLAALGVSADDLADVRNAALLLRAERAAAREARRTPPERTLYRSQRPRSHRPRVAQAVSHAASRAARYFGGVA